LDRRTVSRRSEAQALYQRATHGDVHRATQEIRSAVAVRGFLQPGCYRECQAGRRTACLGQGSRHFAWNTLGGKRYHLHPRNAHDLGGSRLQRSTARNDGDSCRKNRIGRCDPTSKTNRRHLGLGRSMVRWNDPQPLGYRTRKLRLLRRKRMRGGRRPMRICDRLRNPRQHRLADARVQHLRVTAKFRPSQPIRMHDARLDDGQDWTYRANTSRLRLGLFEVARKRWQRPIGFRCTVRMANSRLVDQETSIWSIESAQRIRENHRKDAHR